MGNPMSGITVSIWKWAIPFITVLRRGITGCLSGMKPESDHIRIKFDKKKFGHE